MTMLKWQRCVLHIAALYTLGYSSDPELNKDALGIIQHYGYNGESHNVMTDDGYVITVHRIRANSSQAPVILVQHGLLCSSADWLLDSPNGSLGFILADAGFDVWLGNTRGNTYARRHRNYTPEDTKFWDFTWQDHALLDTPAIIRKMMNVTGRRSIGFVGHSQATLAMFTLMSLRPEWSEHVEVIVALAPVASVSHVTLPQSMAKSVSEKVIYAGLGNKDFLSSTVFIRWLGRHLCDKEIGGIFCQRIISSIGGSDNKEMNISRLPVYIAHTPAGTSIKNLMHYRQMMISKKWQLYDYGPIRNTVVYGQVNVPELSIANVHTPIVAFSASRDPLADPTDVAWLMSRIPNLVSHTVIQGWSHLHFMWATTARKLVYQKIIEVLLHYHQPAGPDPTLRPFGKGDV